MKKSTKIIIAIVVLAVLGVGFYLWQNRDYWLFPDDYCNQRADHCPKLWCKEMKIDCSSEPDPDILGGICSPGLWCLPRFQ